MRTRTEAMAVVRLSLLVSVAIASQLFLFAGQGFGATDGFRISATLPDGRVDAWDNIDCWGTGSNGYSYGVIGAWKTAHFQGAAPTFGTYSVCPSGTWADYPGTVGLGYNGNTGPLNGHGTLAVESGTFIVRSGIRLGRVKSVGSENTGTLNIVGGTLIATAITDAGTAGTNDIHVTSGTLNCGYDGAANNTPHSITGNLNTTFEFTGGTIANITTARITSLSGAGTVSNLTGLLTLDLAGNSTFSGNVAGSGAGNVLKANTGMLTLAPAGDGTVGPMSLLGFTTGPTTTLKFDMGDLITIGSGGLTVNPGTPIEFATPPTLPGYYELITGQFGTPNLSNFVLPTPPSGTTYALSTTIDPGYIVLLVGPPAGAVPEPAALGLVGLALLATRKRRS